MALNDTAKKVFSSVASATTGMNNIYLTRTRLYVCGVLMPVVNVEITSGMDNYPVATFSLPPDQRLLEIGRNDKIPVHIFQQEAYVESPNYILVFYGHIVSRAYQNTAVNRSITFKAISYYSLLNEIQVNFLNKLDDYNRLAIPGVKEEARLESVDPNMDPIQHLMLYGVGTTDSASPTMIDFPYQYLSNVLDWMIKPWEDRDKAADAKTFKYCSNLAEVYGRYFANYTAGTNSYAKLPYFDDTQTIDGIGVQNAEDGSSVFPVLKGVQGEVHAAIIGAQQSAGPEKQTVRGLIDILSDNFEYELACFASPSYNATTGTLNDLCFKPMFADSIPPLCNVIFRSQVINIAQEEIFNTQATRIRFEDTTSAATSMAGDDSSSPLVVSGLTTFYPNKDTQFDMEGALDAITKEDTSSAELTNAYATLLLSQEYFSGVHVYYSGSPLWWGWLNPSDVKDETTQTYLNSMGEYLAQRLLMQAIFAQRTITVTTTYNPYITPGFPGVVFDATTTNLAFAGYITSVAHNITKTSAETTFSMSYVRTLDYASNFFIRHPIQSMEYLLHNEEAMTNVYNAILGSTDSNVSQIPGALALSFYTIREQFMADTSDNSSPQNDPFKAYALQRRNIVTFEDFLSFMKLKVGETGKGPDGDSTPLTLATGDSRSDDGAKIFDDRWPIFVPVSTETATAKTTSSEESTTTVKNDKLASLQTKLDSLSEKIEAAEAKVDEYQEMCNAYAQASTKGEEVEAAVNKLNAAQEEYASLVDQRREVAEDYNEELDNTMASLTEVWAPKTTTKTDTSVSTATTSGGVSTTKTEVTTVTLESDKGVKTTVIKNAVTETKKSAGSVEETTGEIMSNGFKKIMPAALLRAVAKQEFGRAIYV